MKEYEPDEHAIHFLFWIISPGIQYRNETSTGFWAKLLMALLTIWELIELEDILKTTCWSPGEDINIILSKVALPLTTLFEIGSKDWCIQT